MSETQTTPATPAAAPRISELTSNLAALVAFENIVKDATIRHRTLTYDRLREEHEDTGGKSFQAKTASGDVMAEIVLTDTSEAFKVTDADAFGLWVMANFPTEYTLTYTVKNKESLDKLVEAHPEHFDMKVEVKPAFSKGLLTAKRLEGTEVGVIVKDSGSIVDGVTHTPGATATGLTTKWKNGNAGKELAAAELLSGAAERLFTSYIEGIGAAELESGQA